MIRSWLILLATVTLLATTNLHGETAHWHAVSLSRRGGWVAMQDSSGAVWLVDCASHRRRAIGKPQQGTAVFHWSPDDRRLAVESGMSIAVWDTRSRTLLSTLQGSSAEYSPDSNSLAFVREHNLWISNKNGLQARPMTFNGTQETLDGETDFVYAREFGVSRHYWWSPDSSTIAYIETRYQDREHYVLPGKALPVFHLKLIGLKTQIERTIVSTDSSWAYILRVSWHPDSQRLVFYRMNRSQNAAELCEYDGNQVAAIQTESDPYWVNVPTTPMFLGDGSRILVSSERTGYRHIYLSDLTGKYFRDLTPGEMEVSTLNPGLLVTASTGTKQEQQLFRLRLDGAAPQVVTGAVGWHEVQVSDDGTSYLDTFSRADTPPSVLVNKALLFAAEPTDHFVKDEFCQIPTHSGEQLPGRLYKPRNFQPGMKYPLIVYVAAGPQGRAVSDAWGGWEMEWNRDMVRRGFIVLAIDPRGAAGYGHRFEEPIHYRLGAQEVADLREVLAYLRMQPYVDQQRVGIWGSGYGGHVTVHAMLKVPNGFASGFALNAITNWHQYDAYFTERYLGPPHDLGVDYEDSGALDSAKKLTGRLQLAEFAADGMVPRTNVEALQRRMAKVTKPLARTRFSTIEVDGDPRDQMTTFFQQSLRKGL